tara:strand:- start:204 stop:335 length:132 start_codon:yes stop_codon:yes gene_type:complete
MFTKLKEMGEGQDYVDFNGIAADTAKVVDGRTVASQDLKLGRC